MEFKTEYPRFLLCRVDPAEGMCCKVLPLKAGVLIVSVLDVIIALLSLSELILTLWSSTHESTHTLLLISISDLLALSAAPFALLALFSLSTSIYRNIHLYSLYKQTEFLVLSLFILISFKITCIEGDQGCDIVSMTAVWVVRCAFNLYFTYIVWSADVRLRNNETLLVLFGRDMVKIMQEQAIVASPRAVDSGQ